MIREIETGSGVLGISIFDEQNNEPHVKIEYYRGKDVGVTVPEKVDEGNVTQIGKKAFLGAKTVTKIELPDTVDAIGDWAFASCSALKEIVIPARKISYGSGLFRDCDKLEKVTLKCQSDNAVKNSDIPYLLALAVSKMDAAYLFDIEKAGSADWINHFDSVISQILDRDDSDGFSKMLLCGEEDYVGDESNFDTYCLLKKKEKVRILLVRLLHPFDLGDSYRERFSKYLSGNMDAAVWPLVLEEHGDEQEYFKLLIDTGCINDSNISKLIDSMGERNTQMKGYLIRHKGENSRGGDFFGGLDL